MSNIVSYLKKINRLTGWVGLMSGLLVTFAITASSAWAANPNDLWFYITNDKAQDVQDLLQAGMNPNSINNKKQPALMQAVRDQAWKSFDVILANPNTDVNLGNQFDETPLMYVSLVGDTERAQRLIARGAKVNKSGWTPLHYSSVKGQAGVVKLLLANGARVNEISPEGDTALLLAVQTDSMETVQLLINAGADPLASNLKAQDSIDMARLKGKDALARALEKVVQDRKNKSKAQ
jgi:ankyrin repeat protein